MECEICNQIVKEKRCKSCIDDIHSLTRFLNRGGKNAFIYLMDELITWLKENYVMKKSKL